MNSANLKIRGKKVKETLKYSLSLRKVILSNQYPTQLRSCNVMTVCNSSCRKVMFLHLSVILFMGGGGHVWWGDVHGRGACMVGGVCGKGGHVWQRGCAWQGACMVEGVHGRGHVWQERRSLQRMERILLEYILACSYMCASLLCLMDLNNKFIMLMKRTRVTFTSALNRLTLTASSTQKACLDRKDLSTESDFTFTL